MKVAIVHNFHSESTPSGENVVVEAEAEALRSAGLEVRLVRLDNDQMAARTLHVPQAAISTAFGLGFSPLRMLGDFEPDVVHVHNLFPYFGRNWAKKLIVPLVVTLHNYRPMCANGILFRDGDICTLCVGRSGWPAVRHGCFNSPLESLPLALANSVSRHEVLAKAKTVLVLSERSRTIFLEGGMSEDVLVRDWHFVPDGLADQPGRDQRRTWLYVGRLTPEKGIDRLVREWPKHQPLVIVGDGELREELERIGADKQVTLKGSLSRHEVIREMKQAFGLIVPSLWYETFGLIYIEALSVGLPVIAFPPNVIADEVAAENTGIVGEWGHVHEALDKAELTFGSLRHHCRTLFEERYDQTSWTQRRISLYESLIK